MFAVPDLPVGGVWVPGPTSRFERSRRDRSSLHGDEPRRGLVKGDMERNPKVDVAMVTLEPSILPGFRQETQ